MLARLVARLEEAFFAHRGATLGVLALVTVVMGVFAAQLRMTAGFDKQLPPEHEYIQTFYQYRDQVFGANRVNVVVRAKNGDMWSVPFLRKLADVTQAVMFMPGVDRRTVSSLWTPTTRVLEITEEGFESEDVIGGDITPDTLTPEKIAKIRRNAIVGGYIGQLVANDNSGAMVVADLMDSDPVTRKPLDYLDLARRLEQEVRQKHETADFDVAIIGFAKEIGDIADGATSVIRFFALAFLLTALAVWIYCRSWALTALALGCSLVSVVWQFGTLRLLGYGLDPLAVLVPFLVFAIGVSHGVQQINYIVKEVSSGADTTTAARRSFTGLLIPGTMALVTAFVGFATLMLIPIPMIRELAITAAIGVAYKIVTNLVMLPVAASYLSFDDRYVGRVNRLRERRGAWMGALGRIAEPRNAAIGTLVCVVLFAVAWQQSQGRHIGHLQPGAPELRADSRYNRDANEIVARFDLGLDVLSVVVETPKDACYDHSVMEYLNQFSWQMANVPGVVSVASIAWLAKQAFSGFNEGNPKWAALPRDPKALANAISMAPEGSGLTNPGCTVMPVHLYLSDHKAGTVKDVTAAVKAFRAENADPRIKVRLASGNVGVQAATNEVLETTELKMMLYVYLTIVALVLLTYRDWRAMLACCLPLTLATFLGYWFMKELDIGLTVATLPVMVLAVGIGVDYAFYIYNRLQLHLALGVDIVNAFKQALRETGIATIFTALTLSVGVATWSFSDLKFQADMGLLLTFMFMVNMLMAITLLPALAVMIDKLIPRRRPVRAPLLSH
ncbi:MAG TPA: efflux RND transporter permease subunit [Casimicrobiaceae bacterium]|nr:efflux RND transporter permease subunit [Casimicrobiaceae bacterium]